MIKKGHHKLKYLLFLILAILLYYLITESKAVQYYLANPELLKSLILSFGILAPIAIILLQTFQTTISIIPSQITTIVAGFVFGPVLGLVYSLIGAFFGSMIIFVVGRKYGKELALKLFGKKEMVHFHIFFKQKKKWALFLARIAPIFPNDLVSFMAGLTSIRLRDFNWVSTFGFILQMVILTYFGSELAAGEVSVTMILITVVVSLLLLLLIFKRPIKKFLIKELHLLEKEEKLLEKEFKKI
ncbi:TVP38/TMEM64 family protein [Candidatus Woesearchaeota archaeon]|jgi:uncharacterized membrane protein YdjX (TVP38/TMEM64 family)|nr:TVP38/TMEM64 family protein [Candidatus Woesearchaeota archaeon]MBT5342003.1 TVP38/TMEM64 family protein [Candidatus Woesearchaeota archaeon]